MFRHVSLGAAGWPCLLQAFACWVPSAGPFSCIWRREWFCSHFIPPKPIQRPFAPSAAFSADAPCFGQLMPWISLQNPVLFPKGRVIPLHPASLGPLVSGAAGRPCLLLAFTCWVPSAGPFSCFWRRAWFCSQCFRSRLLALWFRELQGGPVCCRPLRVGCRLPAHSAALGDVHGFAHILSLLNPFRGPLLHRRPFRQTLLVLGS